ncbi:MAG: hypothetical protein DMF56_09345 [Acidobacteria bacterium]|nr:MAG: hypothetical protein DMF56_09345 [Acidobacteriota bacterium]
MKIAIGVPAFHKTSNFQPLNSWSSNEFPKDRRRRWRRRVPKPLNCVHGGRTYKASHPSTGAADRSALQIYHATIPRQKKGA